MEWINAEEKSPNPIETVLVYVDAGKDSFQSTGFIYPNKSWTWHRNAIIFPSAKVTHWMPLPKAPESTELPNEVEAEGQAL